MSVCIRLALCRADRKSGFVDMLNEMRFGNLSPQSVAEFKKLSRPIYYEDGMEATEL